MGGAGYPTRVSGCTGLYGYLVANSPSTWPSASILFINTRIISLLSACIGSQSVVLEKTNIYEEMLM